MSKNTRAGVKREFTHGNETLFRRTESVVRLNRGLRKNTVTVLRFFDQPRPQSDHRVS